jgi:hypothetical protein
VETITFDPDDPEVSSFFQQAPSSGVAIPAGSSSTQPRPDAPPPTSARGQTLPQAD